MKLAFMDNPITRAELRYQRHTEISHQPSRLERWLLRFWAILRFVAIADTIILLCYEFFAALTGFDLSSLPHALHMIMLVILYIIPMAVLIPITVVIHFRTQLRTLALSANSISREKRTYTWDLMLLTGTDARLIVRGKWWATVQKVWHSYLLLSLLRIGAIFWVTLEATQITSISMYPTFNLDFHPPLFEASPLHMLFAGIAVITYTFVNLGYTAAFGTFVSLFRRSSQASVWVGIVMRTVVMIGLALIVGLAGPSLLSGLHAAGSYGYDFDLFNWRLYQMLSTGGLILFDNGLFLAIILIAHNGYYRYYAYDHTNASLAGGVIALGIGLLLTWLILQLAQRIAVRQAALDPSHDLAVDKFKNKKHPA